MDDQSNSNTDASSSRPKWKLRKLTKPFASQNKCYLPVARIAHMNHASVKKHGVTMTCGDVTETTTLLHFV